MLTKRQKQEMLQDAASLSRRKDFAKGKTEDPLFSCSLDEFIKFVDSIQRVFPIDLPQDKPTITTKNRL